MFWHSVFLSSGLSLKSQELTVAFLAVRLYCSFIMGLDIHTVLDFATLVPTLWVVYMIQYRLKSSYIKELDSMPRYYLVINSTAINIYMLSRMGFDNAIYLIPICINFSDLDFARSFIRLHCDQFLLVYGVLMNFSQD